MTTTTIRALRGMARRAPLALLVALTIVAAGCAPNGEDEATDDGTPAAAVDGDAAPGGRLVAAFYQSISSLDPHGPHNADQGLHLVSRQIYDTLVVRDGDEFLPSLAVSWEQPDALTWIFNLRDDVAFHDGAPFTATDVVASLERLAASETPLAPLWAQLDNVEATDDHTVTIRTQEPLGTVLTSLTMLHIAPADRLDEEGFFEQPVGTGPFKVEQFLSEERLELRANDDYWDGPPKLEELAFVDMPEEATRVTALRTGEIHAIWDVSAQQLPQLEAEANIAVDQVSSFLYYFIWHNSSREPFSDARVRRAMWHAVDTATLAEELFAGTGGVATAPIPSSVFGHCPQEPYEYDPDKARQLLEDAGVTEGVTVEMIRNTGGGPQIEELNDLLVSAWRDIGITVDSAGLERAQWIERLLALDWDLDLQTNGVLTGDADFTLGRLYHSEANRNGYANEELDRLLVEAREETDPAARAELYCQANEIIWSDAVGIFPVELLMTYATASNINGLEPDPAAAPRFHRVSLDQ